MSSTRYKFISVIQGPSCSVYKLCGTSPTGINYNFFLLCIFTKLSAISVAFISKGTCMISVTRFE